MHLLFIDTETTGKPKRYTAPASQVDNWPRLVEICWITGVQQDQHVTLGQPIRYVIKPDGFEIPAGAAAIHGITTDMAIANGEPVELVLHLLKQSIDRCDLVVAHNVEFDVPVLGAEYHRLSPGNDPLAGKRTLCTMRRLTDWCNIPGHYGCKWPTLQELHGRLFGRQFDDAHSAEADVAACAGCYAEAIRRGLL